MSEEKYKEWLDSRERCYECGGSGWTWDEVAECSEECWKCNGEGYLYE